MEDRKINIFTFINQIQTKNNKIPFDKKIASSYILSLFLSMNKEYIKKVNEINKYQFVLSDKAIYDYYMSVIPKGKTFCKFIKKRKEEEKEDEISKLKEEYPELSTNECMMIITSIKNRLPF